MIMANLSEVQKKRILIGLVIFECLVGSLCIGWFIHKKITNQLSDGEKVTKMDKTSLDFSAETEFKYYFQLKPNTKQDEQATWLPYVAHYTYNADGLHEPVDYSVEKPPNTIRIMALGDSFTFGQFVSTADNWPEKLEVLLNQQSSSCSDRKFEVINMGVGSFDVPYIIHRYLTIGDKYQPDLIVWLEAGSGFARLNEFMRPLIETCETQHISPTANPSRADDYYACWNQASAKLVETYPPTAFANLLMKDFDLFFAATKSKPFFMLSFADSVNDPRSAEIFAAYRQKYPQAVFDFVIPDLTGQAVLPDRHPSRSGHTKIAQAMFDYLNQHAFNDLCLVK